MTEPYADARHMTDDAIRDLLSQAMDTLEKATSVQDLKPVLEALIVAKKQTLDPPNYTGF